MREHETEQARVAAAPAKPLPTPTAPQSALARSLAAGQHALGGAESQRGDGALAEGLAHAVRRRGAVARSVIDDVQEAVSGWWNGGEQATKVEREAPITAQDFNQLLNLVVMPVTAAQVEIQGEPDVARARAAVGKLTPAISALQVIAGTKREPKHRDRLYEPSGHLQAGSATLRVLAESDKAPDVWKGMFEQAMSSIDAVLAEPVRDESKDAGEGQDKGPAADPEALTQRDHGLVERSLKQALQNLITTTSGTPYTDWNPEAVAGDGSILAAFSAFSSRKLLTAKARVTNGLQAIKAFAMSMQEQKQEANAKLEHGLSALATAMQSFTSADPNAPGATAPAPPEQAPE